MFVCCCRPVLLLVNTERRKYIILPWRGLRKCLGYYICKKHHCSQKKTRCTHLKPLKIKVIGKHFGVCVSDDLLPPSGKNLREWSVIISLTLWKKDRQQFRLILSRNNPSNYFTKRWLLVLSLKGIYVEKKKQRSLLIEHL